MHKLFRSLGWVVIAGGLFTGMFAYFFLRSQDFLLALLARVVERPFEYRSFVALLVGVAVVLTGCLVGALFVGIGEILGAFGRLGSGPSKPAS